MLKTKQKIIQILRWTQKYTKTDMVYAAKGGFWIIAQKIGLTILSLATMWAFANWTTKEVFGIYQFVIASVGVLAIFNLPGLKTAVVRGVAKQREGVLQEASKTAFRWSLIKTVILFGVSTWYFYHENTVLGWSFLIAGLIGPIRAVAGQYSHYWIGKKRFDIQSKYSVTSEALSTAALIITIFFTDNPVWIILAFFGSEALFNYTFYKVTLSKTENQKTDTETIPYGKNLTLMSALGTIAGRIDKIIMWKFLGPVQLAIYSLAYDPIQRIKGFAPISTLAFPKLSEKTSVREIKRGIMSKFWRLMVLMVPLSASLIIVAPFVFRLFFAQYTDSVVYFQALSFGFLIMPFSLLSSSLHAEMKTRELYVISTLSPIFKIVLLSTLIPFYGIWGAVIAMLLEQLFSGILTFYYFQKV